MLQLKKEKNCTNLKYLKNSQETFFMFNFVLNK